MTSEFPVLLDEYSAKIQETQLQRNHSRECRFLLQMALIKSNDYYDDVAALLLR